VNLIIEDGRNYLLGTERLYDVISLEPPNIFSAGVVNLYSVEFYELARARLKPGGIMVQWVPTIETSIDDRGSLLRAFTEVFPYVSVWQQLASSTLLFVGSTEPVQVDVDEIENSMQAGEMRKDVEAMGVKNALGFLSFFLLDDASARRLAEHHEPVRDDRTIVDYSMPRFVGSGFGFSIFTLAIGDKEHNPRSVLNERFAEYKGWGDPASAIVADPVQARRVDRAIQLRKSGKPGHLASEEGASSD
jgi:hypothetical protein